MDRNLGRVLILAILCVAVGNGSALAQQSASFMMERVSATAVGDTASSATFTTTVVLGEASPVGAASFCNSGFVNSVGFWSVLGDLPVPIHLRLGKDLSSPGVIEMSWSGSADLFEVFRSSTPVGVVHPLNSVSQTGVCEEQRLDTFNMSFYVIEGVAE